MCDANANARANDVHTSNSNATLTRYVGAVKDSQTFSKMAVKSEALASVSLLFVVFQYRVDENNRYLFSATENVRLYGKLFEIHFCIKSDCICCLYFLSLNKRFFGPLVLLPHIFRQEFPLIYLNNVYHKAPDISLYYLPISRLKWKKPSCIQLQCAVVAWNRWNRLFLLSLRLHLRLPCVRSHV